MPRSRSTAIQSERARRLDRAAKQQQFLGQCGLARVRMRDDRKGAPAGNLVGQGRHVLVTAVAGYEPPTASDPAASAGGHIWAGAIFPMVPPEIMSANEVKADFIELPHRG